MGQKFFFNSIYQIKNLLNRLNIVFAGILIIIFVMQLNVLSVVVENFYE